MKKRPPRPASKKKPPPARAPKAPGPGPLLYKVVELSTVDEGALERTINTWSRQGWNLDGVQFAMRESSKRPAMAFVFFTREGPPLAEAEPADEPGGVVERLHRPGGSDEVRAPLHPVSAHERLRQLAESGDEDDAPLGPSGADRWLDPDE